MKGWVWFPGVAGWFSEGRNWAEPGRNQERMSGSKSKTAMDLGGHTKGVLKKPWFVHPTGGLWGIRDEGPIKGCVLPVWAETPLKSLALHQCHCPTAHTQTLELLPVVPSKEFFWPKSFYFPSSAPASVQGSSESQGDVETTAGSFYPSVSSLWSSTTSCCSCASTGPLLLLFYSAISPLDYVLSAPTGCPQAQQTLVGASKEGKGDVKIPILQFGHQEKHFTRRSNQTPSASMP